ncbi:winged helix-turn-helix domain-containing protein [Nocardia sp. NPDC005366]|uniref:AfsR/SARP family transcriptional regulator n=1 Tax=Nocardia sp. NPDC005366 TaxID=3156878 RepID=UPI0033A6501E
MTVDGRPAALRGPMQGAVLARLVVAAGAVVSADLLIEDLWQGEPPPKASSALQAHISYLRRALEPHRPPRAPARVVISQAPGYALRAEPTTVDAWHFERLLATAATEPDLSTHYRALGAALSLWRGPALAAYADSDWAAAEITRLLPLLLPLPAACCQPGPESHSDERHRRSDQRDCNPHPYLLTAGTGLVCNLRASSNGRRR